MNHDIVASLDHPVAPWFVAERLSHGERRVTCVAHGTESVRGLRSEVETLLRQRGSARIEDTLSRLAVIDSGAPGNDADGRALTCTELFVFLSGSAISRLLRDPNPSFAHESLAACSAFGRPSQVHVVADILDLPREQPIDRMLGSLEHVFRVGTSLRVHLLGPYVCDSSCGPAIEALVDQIMDVVSDVKRRSPQYFRRYPLRLRLDDCGAIRVMSAMSAAIYLAGADQTTRPGRHFAFGEHACTVAEIVGKVAHASGTEIRGITDQSGNLDQASSIASRGLRAIVQRCRIGVETIRSAGLREHALPAEAVDLSAHVERVLEGRLTESKAMQQPFAALSGLEFGETAMPSLRYFRCGTGTEALLIVNAFGLSLDFWQMLASALREGFTLIALDKSDSAKGSTSIAHTYYSADDYAGQYVADVASVLGAEGIERCHVVSWCSGAKLAIELADALPRVIKSLSLLAPSFAGIDAVEGCDSAYERNLHTMCKIVRRTPKAAGNMANSMMAIMTKASSDLDRLRADAKDAVDVLELPDAHQLPLLYQPFASAESMVEFSRQLMHFRSHDITPKLLNETLCLPVMLVTGRADTTTSAARAKDICGRLGNVVGFELEGSSHYLIHQNYRIVADLIKAFTTDGIDMSYTNPRVERSVFREMAETVSGEV